MSGAPAATPARAVALRVLVDVEGRGPTLADRLAAPDASALDVRERAFLHELVLGTLRARGRVDAALRPALDQELGGLEAPVRAALRLGAYQLIALRVPDRAAVSESVALLRATGHRAAGLVNAVLRRVAREGEPPEPDPMAEPQRWLESHGSLPGWLARRWLRRLGREAAVARARALLQPAPVDFRLNPRRAEAGVRAAELAAAPLPVPGAWRAPAGSAAAAARLADEGLVWILDQGSQLVGRLAAAPGRALDVCSAPGGKSALLADGPASAVVALENAARRLEAEARLLRRWGAERVRLVQADARRVPLRGRFDTVLVDAPCSGLGTIGRHPDLRWRQSGSGLARHARRQRELLAAAAPLVADGGRLVYSTCSTEPEENEEVVAAFLSGAPGFAPAEPPPWGEGFRAAGALQTRPERDGGDGFYAIALRRS